MLGYILRVIMKKIIFLLSLVIFIFGCSPKITNFEECVNAGNSIMESYPRQCSVNDQIFVEEIDLADLEIV
jgi:hypothetical protein